MDALSLAIRLLRMARKYWPTLALASVGLVGATLASLVTPWLVRDMVAALGTPQGIAMGTIGAYAAILVVAYLVRAASRFCNTYVAHIAAWSFVPELTQQLYEKLQSLSLKFYHNRQTGQIMSRAINDSRQIEVLVAHALPDLMSNALMVLFVTMILFTMNAKLALLTLIPVPFIVLMAGRFAKKVTSIFRECQSNVGDMNAFLQDNLSGMKEIQAFGQEKREAERFRVLTKFYTFINIRANFFNGLFHPGVEFFTSLGTVIVVGFGGIMAIQAQMAPADIVGFLMYLGLFYQPVATLARLAEDVQLSYAGAVRVFEILDAEPDIVDSRGARDLANCKGHVSFDHVNFHYESSNPVLRDVSFEAKPGQMIALVGPTGVGKTTIVSLLERFYDPVSGSVRIDGQNIRDVTLSSLRANLSLVLQDVFLFNGSVADNIGYGVPDAKRDDIERAARIACAHEFICKMPEGYDTVVGERGVRLSGGQKQRLAIARAVLRNSPVLILDEATAAVDVETEAQIQEAIQNLAGSRTLIVIAHRLSTVKRADQILVMEDGCIVERGNHQQLIAQGGLYARLCDIQLKASEITATLLDQEA